MKTIGELKQNSPEWHAWRAEGIGASEANIIMGASKFMTPLQLWDQKVNGKKEEENNGNFITDKGHRLEAKARPMFEMEIDADFPDTIAVMESNNVFRASLDGYNEDLNACWECKFVGQEDFETVKNGGVIEHYFPQLQHQLMVTGADINYLYVIADDAEKKEAGSKWPFKTAFIEVFPDTDYIENRLLPELMSFWKKVETKKAPKITDLDIVDLSKNEELSDILSRYELLKKDESELKGILDGLQKEIYKIAKHSKNICNGVKITKSKSEDSIKPDYEKYALENNLCIIELGYQKTTKGRITKRITFPKE